MSKEQTVITAAPKITETPYKLDTSQTTKACKVLLKHINEERQRRDAEAEKPNLLAQGDEDNDEDSDGDQVPIWMIMTTKKHIVDQKRLKPSKIALPHSINTSPNSTICLITADPASAYRTAIDQPNFPAELRSRITRVIGLSKMKTDFKAFEARRKLFAEHDVFLADDRVITFLPKLLGKVFYKSGSKRPVPVSIAAPQERGEDGKRVKRDLSQVHKGAGVEGGRGSASPEKLAKELEKSLGSALVHLAPGTSTAVKVGTVAMTEEEVSKNIEAVVKGLTDKFVTKGWRNVRAIHIKGPETVAFPIWLASELWVEDQDVREQQKTFGKKSRSLEDDMEGAKMLEEGSKSTSKKRKADTGIKAEDADKHAKKKLKADKLAAEVASRKEKLKKQKQAALAQVDA